MGGRAGGAGGTRGIPTMGELRLLQKKVSSLKAQYTKAQKEYSGAQGYFYWTAQSEWAKQEAKDRLSKAYNKFAKTQSDYYTAKDLLEAKTKAYQSKMKFNPNDIDLPF